MQFLGGAHLAADTRLWIGGDRMGGMLSALFKVKKLELVLVGIENSGKSTLLNMMAMGTSIQTVPTVGLSVKTMKHAGVSMKVRSYCCRRS